MGWSPPLFLRLLRMTLAPRWPTGPRTPKRLLILFLFLPAFLLLQALHWMGFFLDELLFPGYRRVEIREPLFIVGLPRSGTTFLHRVFARDTDRFTTLRLWELLLAPSITERKVWMGLGALDRVLGRPFARLAGRAGRSGLAWLDVIHQVSLDDPEEDYFLLLPVFACFLLVVPFPYHDAVWNLARFDELDVEEREPIMRFYAAALRRHLYVAGPEKQLLSKNPSFTPFLQSLMETFPEGKFLCCVRDPLSVVPSLLSSIRTGAHLFGYDVSEPTVRDRFLNMLEFFAQHAQETLDSLPEDRRAFVPLGTMKRDLKGFVMGIYDQFGWEMDSGFRGRLKEDAQRGRRHRSKHAYSLAEFGLAEEEVRRRFHSLIHRFGFSEDSSGAADGGQETETPSVGSGE